MTTKLAELLRQAAEKWPEKFRISFALGEESILIMGGGGFGLPEMDNPDNLTLDHMDAIAEACGMVFEVGKLRDGWIWFTFNAERTSHIPIAEAEGRFPDKRTASLAALCAILKLKYGEGNNAQNH